MYITNNQVYKLDEDYIAKKQNTDEFKDIIMQKIRNERKNPKTNPGPHFSFIKKTHKIGMFHNCFQYCYSIIFGFINTYFTHIGSNVLVNQGGSIHEENFRFQSAIHPSYGYIQRESRNDDKSWLVPLTNIHDLGTLELGTITRPLTRRFSDTEHSTGVTNTIDYRNYCPNYQEWEFETELNRKTMNNLWIL